MEIKSKISLNRLFLFDVLSSIITMLLAITIMHVLYLFHIQIHIKLLGIDMGNQIIGRPYQQGVYVSFFYFFVIQLLTYKYRKYVLQLLNESQWWKIYTSSGLSGLLIFGAFTGVNYFFIYNKIAPYFLNFEYLKVVFIVDLGMRMGTYTFFLIFFYGPGLFFAYKIFKRLNINLKI